MQMKKISTLFKKDPQAAIWETENVAYIDCLEYGDTRDCYYREVKF